ncbi:unnamed protein product [Acanthoscelides obtectus]|uniref:Uncharacterized protein n=2 Tax=Acanthoscelides obtectus TaxID=200917 RepID=A0A9P0NXQ7_ACAOB|nr:unnamed protein product [Acanthoscelides obtectus]CAK1647910.1 hypothetical protein AOBTE_LOCUS15451 [Acanthoscelides obtectus]
MLGYFQIMSMVSSRTKRILAALSQNDESNNVYFEEEIGSMPISIISSDNIFDLDNSEKIFKNYFNELAETDAEDDNEDERSKT